MNDGKYQYGIIEKLSFNRTGGTLDELRAANILKSEVEALGGTASLEPFTIKTYTARKAVLRVTEPFEREITVTVVGRTGSTAEGGIDAEFKYIEAGEEIDFIGVSGKIVMLNALNLDIYKRLTKSGAAGFLVFDGGFLDDEDKTDLGKRYIRELFIENGLVPGLNMRVKDAIEMVRDGASKVHFELIQDEIELTSHNVVADIKGSEKPEEIIAFTAHYDSVPFSPGAWDNASGSADLMYLYRCFSEHKPMRTLRFIWCGSEELGLLGSKAYTEAHDGELEGYKFCINIDMTGPVLGNDIAVCTTESSLLGAMDFLAREMKHSIRVSQGVYSSDSTPFADHGVPAVSFARTGQAGAHSRNDIISPLCPANLAHTMEYILAFTQKIANGQLVGVPRSIPQNMKDEIDKYYRREKK